LQYKQGDTQMTNYKRLYRSRDDRMIGGVCSGLGEYLFQPQKMWFLPQLRTFPPQKKN